MVTLSKKTRRYPTGLTDEEWSLIEPLMDRAAYLDFTVEIVRRIDTEPGFKVLPRRWGVIARTTLPKQVSNGRTASAGSISAPSAGMVAAALG